MVNKINIGSNFTCDFQRNEKNDENDDKRNRNNQAIIFKL